MSLWKYNDVELKIDMGDVEFQEKYEAAFSKMAESEEKLKKVGKLSDITREYCDMFYTLYDDLFGVGTGVRLMGEKRNMNIANECYASFITCCNKAVEDANKAMLNACKKYTPKRRK